MVDPIGLTRGLSLRQSLDSQKSSLHRLAHVQRVMAVRPSTVSPCPFRRRVVVGDVVNGVLEYVEEDVNVELEFIDGVGQDVGVVFEMLDVVLADPVFPPLWP